MQSPVAKNLKKNIYISVPQCKHRWKKLRDNFRKAVKARKTKSRDAARKIRPWKLEQQMAFLLPHMTERPKTSNIQVIEEETDNSTEEESFNTSSAPPTPSTSSTTTATSRTKIQKSRQVPQANVADVLQNYLISKDTSQKKEENNSIRSFFISMSEATENLPAHLQLEVKSKLFTAVHEAEKAALFERQHGQSTIVQYPPYPSQTSPVITQPLYPYTQSSSSSPGNQPQFAHFSHDSILHNLDNPQ
ncbi:unnamed protein product [Ceutorhynchus assimilis]|uniref:MADF domain-containing protein n=1 Tax=Ceutorhynchus assimilis TaxID=467358 RepID=A0A9N9QN34_9CUCU|nr:unnamed protein product [Ceutorhynchus assimilis]